MFFLAGSIAMGCVGVYVFLTSRGNDIRGVWLGGVMVAAFGFISLLRIWILLDRRPRLIIDDEGIFDRTNRMGLIPWSEIDDAELVDIFSPKHVYLGLKLRPSSKFVSRQSTFMQCVAAANSALGCAKVNLNLSETDADPEDVLWYIQSMLAARRARQKP